MAKEISKKTIKKAASKKEILPIEKIEEFAKEIKTTKLAFLKNIKLTKSALLILVLVLILALVIIKKNWFIVATVNGQPITNLTLLVKMDKAYHSSTLNQLINEKIIFDEAVKKRVVVKDSEVAERMGKLEANVGGKETLDSLLAQQGQTRSDLETQIKIQLIIEKMYNSEASVSAEEIQTFIKENGNQLQASDSAGQTKEAADILKQQKLSKLFSQKFQELKQAANIKIF